MVNELRIFRIQSRGSEPFEVQESGPGTGETSMGRGIAPNKYTILIH